MKMSVIPPTLKYFAICGRGELARLICAAGDLPFVDEPYVPTFDESGNFRTGYQVFGEKHGFPGSFPILEQGEDFALFQSNAIEVRERSGSIAMDIAVPLRTCYLKLVASILAHSHLLLIPITCCRCLVAVSSLSPHSSR